MKRLGRYLVRERLDIFAPFAVIAVFWPWGETEGVEFVIIPAGAFLSLSGLFLRAWSMRHCGKAGASQDRIKRLTTTGPYHVCRNPLYLANMFIFTGLLVISEVLWVIPAFLTYAFVRYGSIIAREESAMSLQFGRDYEEYRGRVPRWRPRLALPVGSPRRTWGAVVGREAVQVAGCCAGAAILMTKDTWLASWILGT
jgi:protein-S-isoprenylcysteine O-methyltransferase Ste14